LAIKKSLQITVRNREQIRGLFQKKKPLIFQMLKTERKTATRSLQQSPLQRSNEGRQQRTNPKPQFLSCRPWQRRLRGACSRAHLLCYRREGGKRTKSNTGFPYLISNNDKPQKKRLPSRLSNLELHGAPPTGTLAGHGT